MVKMRGVTPLDINVTIQDPLISSPQTGSGAVVDCIIRFQLLLADVGRTFPGAVVTDEGAICAPCPVDSRHGFLIRVEDDGAPAVICSHCDGSALNRLRFTEALNARGWAVARVRQTLPVGVTGWTRQASDAPVLALRLLSDGTFQFIAEADRFEEARRWVQERTRAPNA